MFSAYNPTIFVLFDFWVPQRAFSDPKASSALGLGHIKVPSCPNSVQTEVEGLLKPTSFVLWFVNPLLGNLQERYEKREKRVIYGQLRYVS